MFLSQTYSEKYFLFHQWSPSVPLKDVLVKDKRLYINQYIHIFFLLRGNNLFYVVSNGGCKQFLKVCDRIPCHISSEMNLVQ